MSGLLRAPHCSPTKKDLEDAGLSCEVCMEAYNLPPSLKTPKALHCLHTFCLGCCSKLLQPAASGSGHQHIECPSCRKTTKLEEGLDSLVNNFALLRVLDMISLNNAVEPLDGEESSVCEECTAAASASHYCAECGEFLCSDCAAIHRRMRATAEHQVLVLAELKAQGGLPALRSRRSMCRKHAREELKLWCHTCQELVCRDCIILDHPRPEHSYGFAAEAAEQLRALLLPRVEGVRAAVASARALANELGRVQAQCDRQDRRAIEGVSARFEELLAAVHARAAEVVGEAEASALSARTARLAQEQLLHLFIRTGEQCCCCLETALETSLGPDLLAASLRLKTRLGEVEEEERLLPTGGVGGESGLAFTDDFAPLLHAVSACGARQKGPYTAAAVPRRLASALRRATSGPASASGSDSGCTSDNEDPPPLPPGGVQYGQSLQGLLQEGWQVQYHEPYSHATSLSDLDPGRGEWLLVGARKKGHDDLLLAAAARREDVLQRTKGSSDVHESNGTFWYCWEGKAFGFAGSLRVTLSAADTEHSCPETRLSWHVNGAAGWRAGRETHLGEDASSDCFEKIVFFRS